MRNRRSTKNIEAFTAHVEYIYHITCKQCKCYFTYAVMQKNFKIDKTKWYCPTCGTQGTIKIEEEI